MTPMHHLSDRDPSDTRPLLICFSHLRWNFVLQRPQHLMTEMAKQARVVVWEEPQEIAADDLPRLAQRHDKAADVTIAAPQLPAGMDQPARHAEIRRQLDRLVAAHRGELLLWYYTPMMLPYSRHLAADCVVYDCMDELAKFRFAPEGLTELEDELMTRADLVFTGGVSLYEARRNRHASVHAFPSSVDRAHFATARGALADPADQRAIAAPRLGYFGVIDERIDLDLIAAVADAHPHWSLMMVGPLAKIAASDLPRRANIHWLGQKGYADLPAYIAGWDAALMPFAINAATRFISPTKTPEYLAAGCPVVSTPITDVVRQYGDLEAVRIADGAEAFIAACETVLALPASGAWRDAADRAIEGMGWDRTATQMWALIAPRLSADTNARTNTAPSIVASGRGYDVMVVGAGFAGAVMAERLATQAGKRVLVVDKRNHIAGNAFDRLDDAGVLIHQYGPHIFHTNSTEIVTYLSQFTAWRPYEHRVLAEVDGMRLPIPINRTTLNRLYGLDLRTDEDASQFLAARAEPVDPVMTSEDVVVGAVGRELYETFFRGYTRKQWGLDPSELDKSVTARVPTRTNTDDRYFTDSFQAMPAKGYTAMFARMLDHPNIDLLLGTDYREVRGQYDYDHLVFSGPIDEYFDYRFGKLPYRSLRFEHETLPVEHYQEVATVNYPGEDVPFTRITEYKHLTGQVHPRTSITREYPCAEGDPYYSVPRPENQALFKRYEALAAATPGVTFVGRLATYRYYNMDQIVGQALAVFRRRFGNQMADVKPKVASAA